MKTGAWSVVSCGKVNWIEQADCRPTGALSSLLNLQLGAVTGWFPPSLKSYALCGTASNVSFGAVNSHWV